MAILFPGSPIENANWVDFGDALFDMDGFVHGEPLECVGTSFFEQLVDVDVEYAGLVRGSGDIPGSPNTAAKADKRSAINYALSVIETKWSSNNIFRDVISPAFNPGAVRTITRGTGNYAEYAGQAPSELTFRIKGINPALALWSRTYLSAIRPMTHGVYLHNNKGEILGLLVGTITNNTLKPVEPTKFAFLPIPILGIRRTASVLGGLEEPDVMDFSILFPPNWDSPYVMGSSIDVYSASLMDLTSRLGRIMYSALCLVPKSIVDIATDYINR